MNATRFRAGDRRLLVVDAEHYVPDRAAFAAAHCDAEAGVAPPAVLADGAAAPESQPAITGGSGTGQPAAADRSAAGRAVAANADGAVDGVRGADAALFLALEGRYDPPRVVLTAVRPDGERTPFCPDAARCAARWAADRTGAERVMLDTQAGTRAAVVEDDAVAVETADPADVDDPPLSRGPVRHEFSTEVSPRPEADDS